MYAYYLGITSDRIATTTTPNHSPISIPPGPPGLRPPHFAGASSPGSAVAKAHYTKARRAKRIFVKPYSWTTKKLIEKEC